MKTLEAESLADPIFELKMNSLILEDYLNLVGVGKQYVKLIYKKVQ